MPRRTETRVAIYARTSTEDQNIDMQLHDLRRYVEERGFQLKAEFIDAGVSSGKATRPQLEALKKRVRRGGFDAVVVWRFDRAARSTRELATLLEEFEGLGIDFVSLHEGIDTSTPGGRLAFHVFSAVAEFERELLRERTRAGLAAARRRGKKLGRPRREDLDLEEVRRLRDQGLGWRKLSKQLGVPVSTIRSRLARAAADPAG